ncbi:hypothetical protein Tco_1331819 [Tanacetum coccineum]
MDQENLQQAALDEALVPIVDQVKIGSCSMRIDLLKTQKEPTYQLTQDILEQYSCYNAFLITVDVPQTYMQQFWYTITKNKIPNQEFVEPPPHDALVSFVKQPGYKGAMELVFEIVNLGRLTADSPVLRDENRCLILDSQKSSSITSSLNIIHCPSNTARSSTLSNMTPFWEN